MLLAAAQLGFLCISQPLLPSVHDPEPLYSLVQHVCSLAGICVMLQWLVSVTGVAHTCSTHHSDLGSVPSVINSLFCMSSSSVYCLSFSLFSPCEVCCEDSRETQPHFHQLLPREAQMKRYYQPFLSLATPLPINADKRLQYHL